ncbi:MAG: 4-hydroxy-tetrahydrodipicolinate reductase [Firmicutes bacterium]|nr:4-hydroxy-tetrahydrodipicolinate reductase [Bacillota bacterium]
MIDIILNGCGGKMGRVVESVVNSDENCRIVAGIDPAAASAEYPVFSSASQCTVAADVIIDFSTAAAVSELLDFSAEKQMPVVLCTTGLSEELNEKVKETSKTAAVLKSANMSVGVNLIISLAQKAAEMLFDSGFDIEILEKHHNQKIDAPSGTALAIADAVNETLDEKMEYVYDRSKTRQKRERKEIGMHAVRGGTIVGEHDVIFAGKDEIVTLSHQAMSKEIFAVGAVKAAKFLAGKPAGLYSMKDVMK